MRNTSKIIIAISITIHHVSEVNQSASRYECVWDLQNFLGLRFNHSHSDITLALILLPFAVSL